MIDDGVGLEVEPGTGPALLLVHGFGGAKEDFADHVDALARRPHVVDVRPPRATARATSPTTRPRTRSTGSRPTRSRSPTRSALDRFRLLGHSMGGMVARRIVLAQPAPGRRAGPDGHLAGPGARVRRRAHGDRRRRSRSTRGHGRAEADPGRVRAARHARVPADAGRAARLPGVRGPEVGGLSAIMWAHDRSRDRATSPTSSPRLAACHVPDARDRGRAGRAVRRASRRDGGRDPRRRARRHSRRRSLAAVRERRPRGGRHSSASSMPDDARHRPRSTVSAPALCRSSNRRLPCGA